MFSSNRLRKNLGSRKGSRTGNSGNHLELRVLTQIQFVPWVINSAHTHTKLTIDGKILVQFKLLNSTNTGDSGFYLVHFIWRSKKPLLSKQKWRKVKNMEIKSMHPASIMDTIRHPNGMDLWRCRSMCHQRKSPHSPPAAKIPAKQKITIGVHSRIEMISWIRIFAKSKNANHISSVKLIRLITLNLFWKNKQRKKSKLYKLRETIQKKENYTLIRCFIQLMPIFFSS